MYAVNKRLTNALDWDDVVANPNIHSVCCHKLPAPTIDLSPQLAYGEWLVVKNCLMV